VLHKSGAGEPLLLLITGQIELQTLRVRLYAEGDTDAHGPH
jgi:hypothetical protein